MKPAVFYLRFVCLLGALLLAAPAVWASPENGKKLQIEIFGGFSTLNPKDLNGRAEYDRLYEDFYTELRYGYYHDAYGNSVAYSGQVDGEFNKIKQALPVGMRLKYELGPALSVSLGFKYLSNRRDSRVTYQYDVRQVDPDGVQFYDEFSLFQENGPYSISAKAYIPMVGVHYKLGKIRSFNLEAFLAAGPMFAECDFMRRRYASSLDSYDYLTELDSSLEMKGKGTGLALEAGLQINVKVFKHLYLLMEGGYAYQIAGRVSGPGSAETATRDSNSDGYTDSAAWDGHWTMVEGYLENEWGRFPYAYPTGQPGTGNTPNFKLDLSGAQIRLGLSFRL
ncbi:MAG: hypothetical protein WAU81_10040 [Candidatus Aminicenantales bacterium]